MSKEMVFAAGTTEFCAADGTKYGARSNLTVTVQDQHIRDALVSGLTYSTAPLTRGAIRFPRIIIESGDSNTSKGRYNVAIQSISVVNDVATIGCTGHACYEGASFTISCAAVDVLNGVQVCSSIIDLDTLVCIIPGAGTVTETGSPQLILNDWYRFGSSLEMANAILKHPFTIKYNVGKPGKDTPYIAAGFARDVVAHAPHMVAMMEGTNDAINAVAGTEFSVLQRAKVAKLAMFNMCQEAGIRIYAKTCPPLGSLHGSYTAARAQIIMQLNNWLIEMQQFLFPDMILTDVHRILTQTNGDWKTNYTLDGSHGTDYAWQQVAQEEAIVLAPLAYKRRFPVSTSANSYTTDASNPHITLNPLLLTAGSAPGGTGTPTGTMPQLYSGTWAGSGGSIAASLQARADGEGNDAKFVMVSAANNNKFTVLSNSMHTRVKIGDLVRATFRVSHTGMVGLKDFFPYIQWAADVNGVSRTFAAPAGMGTSQAAAAGLTYTDWDDVYFQTLPFRIVSNLTALSIRTWWTWDGVGGGTVLWQPDIEILSSVRDATRLIP